MTLCDGIISRTHRNLNLSSCFIFNNNNVRGGIIMGLFGKLFESTSGTTATCPCCEATMYGDGGERFECTKCTDGGVFFMEDGELVDSMHRGRRSSSGRTYINCKNTLDGGELTDKWEDGDNDEAYITCHHCRCHNPF